MKQNQNGFAMVLVIFLTVVAATIILTMSQMQRSTIAEVARQRLSMQAYYAAQTGLEWGIVRALNDLDGDCSDANDTGFTVAGMDGFVVSVTCQEFTYDGNSVSILRLTASASYGTNIDSSDYVWRSISASIER